MSDQVRLELLLELGLGQNLGGSRAPVLENHQQRNGTQNGDPDNIRTRRNSKFAAPFSAAIVQVLIFFRHVFDVVGGKLAWASHVGKPPLVVQHSTIPRTSASGCPARNACPVPCSSTNLPGYRPNRPISALSKLKERGP